MESESLRIGRETRTPSGKGVWDLSFQEGKRSEIPIRAAHPLQLPFSAQSAQVHEDPKVPERFLVKGQDNTWVRSRELPQEGDSSLRQAPKNQSPDQEKPSEWKRWRKHRYHSSHTGYPRPTSYSAQHPYSYSNPTRATRPPATEIHRVSGIPGQAPMRDTAVGSRTESDLKSPGVEFRGMGDQVTLTQPRTVPRSFTAIAREERKRLEFQSHSSPSHSYPPRSTSLNHYPRLSGGAYHFTPRPKGSLLEVEETSEEGWASRARIQAELREKRSGENPVFNPVRCISSIEMSPIPSYGIILVHADEKGTPFYLLTQGRDTFEYRTLIWGNFKTSKLYILLSLMTAGERMRIQKYTPEELWDDLDVVKTCECNKKYAVEKLKKYKPVINDLISKTQSHTRNPQIGFPQGRMEEGEGEVACARREIQEETGICVDDCIQLSIEPLTETYCGSDGKLYSSKYFVFLDTSSDFPKTSIAPTRSSIRPSMISEEVGAVFWVYVDTPRDPKDERIHESPYELEGHVVGRARERHSKSAEEVKFIDIKAEKLTRSMSGPQVQDPSTSRHFLKPLSAINMNIRRKKLLIGLNKEIKTLISSR